MVALHLGDMIGLGRGEQHLLDARALQQPGNNSAVAITEAFQDRVDSVPRVFEYLAAGQESAKDVHKNDLPRVVTEMLAIKRHDDFDLVGLKAPFHQSSQRAVGAVFDILRNIERGKPHIGVFPERARIEKAAGLQKAEPVLVARRPQVLSIKFMRSPGIVLACGSVMTMISEK